MGSSGNGALAPIVVRVIDPAAKVATARALDETTSDPLARSDARVVSAKSVYAALIG